MFCFGNLNSVFSGETIPLSDSEGEDELPIEVKRLEGVYREREQYVMQQLAKEYGLTPQLVSAAASVTKLSPGGQPASNTSITQSSSSTTAVLLDTRCVLNPCHWSIIVYYTSPV